MRSLVLTKYMCEKQELLVACNLKYDVVDLGRSNALFYEFLEHILIFVVKFTITKYYIFLDGVMRDWPLQIRLPEFNSN